MGDYVFNDAERQILTSEGFLAGLEKLAVTKPALKDTLDGYRSGWMGPWMNESLAEAEKEVARIDAALKRLKAVSNSIGQSRKIPANDPRVMQFRNDLNAVDGWTVSLLETVFRISGFLPEKNPDEDRRIERCHDEVVERTSDRAGSVQEKPFTLRLVR